MSQDSHAQKPVPPAGVSRWKHRLVTLTIALLSVSFLIFFVTGYTALYWAWLRDNLQAAIPFLPWARNCGMLAMACAAMALAILFSSNVFPISPKTRLFLSLLATIAIGFFAEFRNDGKYHFRNLVHFFGPGTWAQDGLNKIAPSVGGFFYRVEFSYLNDFLMGPAIASVLFALASVKIYSAYRAQGSISLSAHVSNATPELEHALRFVRILMNVGLFWFFFQAWAEKAGYIHNPHSNDALDLPFEFAGTILGFWMARVLTGPFDGQREVFKSTFLIDFVSSGVVGLLYTLVVGPLTEGVARAVGHGLYPVVPGSLDFPEYTPLQQHMRPLELLILAAAIWLSLNRILWRGRMEQTDSSSQAAKEDLKWAALKMMILAVAATSVYLLILVAMLALLEPEGLGWTIATVGAGVGIGTGAFLLALRAGRRSFTTLFGRNVHPATS